MKGSACKNRKNGAKARRGETPSESESSRDDEEDEDKEEG
jgi:hypothetical protein